MAHNLRLRAFRLFRSRDPWKVSHAETSILRREKERSKRPDGWRSGQNRSFGECPKRALGHQTRDEARETISRGNGRAKRALGHQARDAVGETFKSRAET